MRPGTRHTLLKTVCLLARVVLLATLALASRQTDTNHASPARTPDTPTLQSVDLKLPDWPFVLDGLRRGALVKMPVAEFDARVRRSLTNASRAAVGGPFARPRLIQARYRATLHETPR